MEREEDKKQRDEMIEDEMNKLRSSSSSPSTLSTASSASPLVRGSSGNNRRPAPTSIAAAQLQRQQLEFTNQLREQEARKGAKTSEWLPAEVGAGKKTSNGAADDEKSFGYKLAKSVAFRAYRLNEFWSVNRLRYMNFVCLLLTLLCLVTILLVSNTSKDVGEVNRRGSGSGEAAAAKKWTSGRLSSSGKNRLLSEEPVESIDSLDSQPLSSSAAGEDTADEDSFDDEAPKQPKIRRKVGVASEKVEESDGAESTTTTTPPQPAADAGQQVLASSLVDPILSQILNDFEIGPLFKKRNGTGIAGTGGIFGKPVITRSKNGATITISSSGALNDSSFFNDSNGPLPMLLEKLLPPIFRPFGARRSEQNGTGTGTGLASATITIGGSALEPLFGAASSIPIRTQQMPFFDPFLPASSLRHFGGHQPANGFFMDGPRFGGGLPFLANSQPSPLGLMSMIMRANNQLDAEEESDRARSLTSTSDNKSNETLSQSSESTSQPNNQTSPQLANNTSTTNKPAPLADDPFDIEIIDGARILPAPKQRNYFPSRARAGPSMLIFSASGNSDSMPSGPANPFAAPDAMLHSQYSPFNPFLRSILNNVMSELNPLANLGERDSNKSSERRSSNPQDFIRQATNSMPQWATFSSDLDNDLPAQASPDRWRMETNHQHRRIRHRDEPTEELESSSDLGEFIMPPLEPGIVGGTIKQTIRGPGMTVERIIEVPSSRVPAGVRSQSLSAIGPDESMAGFFHQPMIEPQGELNFPPRAGLFGRLLSDLSRGDRAIKLQRESSLKDRSMEEDFDETDAVHEEATTKPTKKATTNSNVRPDASNQDPSLLLLQHPPTHFSLASEPEADSEPEREQEKGSFEDTLNSMEDRLNNVLSAASNRHFGRGIMSHKINNHEQQAAEKSEENVRSKGAFVKSSNDSIESVVKQAAKQQDNPFTSPSSPLFGFPASSLIQSEPAVAKSKSPPPPQPSAPPSQQQSAADNNNNHRQQRSFTYHSNNEIALPFVNNQNQRHQAIDQQLAQESAIQSRFMPLLEPQAGIIMGRRLDDQPMLEADATGKQMEFESQPEQQTLDEAANSPRSSSNNHQTFNENYRTIVV